MKKVRASLNICKLEYIVIYKETYLCKAEVCGVCTLSEYG